MKYFFAANLVTLVLAISLISTRCYAQTWDNSVGSHITSGTSILKGSGSGGVSNATSGTEYAPATAGSSILKGNGAGAFANATSGTDYSPATSGSSILKGNGSGGTATAASGTDFLPPIDNNNHTTLQAKDFANDGSFINEIGTDASNNVVIGGGAASGISLSNSTVVNQGSFSSGNYLDASAKNSAFTGGTENCAQKWHQYTLAGNPTLTLSCPTVTGNPQITLDYLFIQPATGSTFTTFTFAATGGTTIVGDTSYVPCSANSCIDEVEVIWLPSLNNYVVRVIKQNINGSGAGTSACPAGQTCHYVDQAAGSDSNAGTSTGAAWKTIGKALTILSAAAPGDEILFKGGSTWTLDGSATNCGSNCEPFFALGDIAAHAVVGTATKPILISSYGTGQPLIDGNNVSPFCFSAINPGFTVNYVTINNFECRHAYAQGIYFKANSSTTPLFPGITISNNYVHDTGPGCATAVGACNSLPPNWVTGTSYVAGNMVVPNTNNTTNNTFIVRAACTASGTQPIWNNFATVGNVTNDAACTWTNVAVGSQFSGPADNWVTWAPATTYASSGGTGGYAAMFISPSVNNAGSYLYQETVASCFSGSTTPTFTQTVGASTTDNSCSWKNTGFIGNQYMNQVGLEDDGSASGHSQNSVKILNNIIKWGGGHNIVEVHGDTGSPLIQGNTVGPGCPHGCIDMKMVGSATTTAQVLSNTSSCGYASNLCGCESNGTCANTITASFYTQNTVSSVAENVLYQLNTAYDSPTGFQDDPNGPANIVAKYYNNTVYVPTTGNTYGINAGLAGGTLSGSTIDLRNNIFDGGANHCVSVVAGWGTAIEDYNDIGGAQGCVSFFFNGGSTRGAHDITSNPLYINATSVPPNFGLQAGSPCINAGLAGLTTGNTDQGAFDRPNNRSDIITHSASHRADMLKLQVESTW